MEVSDELDDQYQWSDGNEMNDKSKSTRMGEEVEMACESSCCSLTSFALKGTEKWSRNLKWN